MNYITTHEPIFITEEQAKSLEMLLNRWEQKPDHIEPLIMENDVLAVIIGGMLIGIEPDGYTHS